MSEYQCHEFIAVDRPLSAKQMAELRRVSTRAEISSTRFWNEYHWGDLKADPAKLLERYFDAYLYFADWGSRRLMLRLPRQRIDVKALKRYFPVGATTPCMTVTKDYVMLDFSSDIEESEYDDEYEASLGALLQLRAELLRGDMRCVYLAWLAAVLAGDVDDDVQEPHVPVGLAKLSAAQNALTHILRLDPDLVSAAAAVTEPKLRRTVADLQDLAASHREKRERAAVARKAKKKRAAEAARQRRLDQLATELKATWTKLEKLVATSAYDDALALAIDLRDLAAREGAVEEFAGCLEAMRQRQSHRRGFFDRWKRSLARR